MSGAAVTIFVLLFALVTVLGFLAARWRRASLDTLHEWGLAGRSFGTLITWFLIGGDLYTAYTFIAVPALVFGAGAMGFFAVPYTILVYPLAFLVMPRLWTVAHRRGYVTAADFVRGRHGSPWLALAVAVTGIVATLPYIALQLVGIQVVVAALGFPTTGVTGELPLVISFAILAAYTYTSGLRAPAMISIVKDILIYVTVIAAIVVIPAKLGGYGAIFSHVAADKLLLKAPAGGSLNAYSAYTTLALGSALALLLYPHSLTAVLSSRGGSTLRRNMTLLPAYSLLLGLIALLGYMARAAGVADAPRYAGYFSQYKSSFAVPALFLSVFPGWFLGIAFAAVAIGALVPAAIMSIAAASLFTRNVYREFVRPGATAADETRMAKWVSLIVKTGAVLFVIALPGQYAINLQLLGGVWIIQTLPAVMLGLYTRWFDHRGLIAGWAAGIAWGTWAMAAQAMKSSTYALHAGGAVIPGYVAFYALILNVAVAAAVTVACRAARLSPGRDETSPADYAEGGGVR